MTPINSVLVTTTSSCDVACHLGPQELLAQYSDGAYTTALVHGFLVVDWQLHMERLVRNLVCLHEQRPPSFEAFMRWTAGQVAEPAQLVEQLVNPLVAEAVAAHQRQLGEHAGGDAMLVVLLADPQGSGASDCQEDGTDSRGACHTGDPSGSSSAEGGSRSSSRAVDGNASSPPLFCAVLVKGAVLPPQDEAVQVLVAGQPRRWAHAKHCQWVLDRRTLEAAKPPGVAELLLCDEAGCIVEGLASNFYAVAEADDSAGGSNLGDGGGSAGGGDGGLAGLVLQTNGPQEQALQGITQRRVLQAAARAGLPVQLSAPLLAARSTWREAFITNCLRGIQPIGRVLSCAAALDTCALEDGGAERLRALEGLRAGEAWQVELSGHGLATQRLQQALAEVQQLTDVRQWRGVVDGC